MKQEELHEAIGYIKAKVEKVDCIEKKIDKLDDRIDRVERNVSRIIGYATGAGATAGIVIAFAKDYIKKLFT